MHPLRPIATLDNLYIVDVTNQCVRNIITRTSFDTDDSFEQRAEDVCEQYSETYSSAWFEIYDSEDLYNDSIKPELVPYSIH
jgi:hypothetical protein